MRRVAGFKSIAECAHELGIDKRVALRRVDALTLAGAPITSETILDGYHPPKSRHVPVLGCANTVAAAKRYKLSRTTLWERVKQARREGKPLTKAVLIDAYGPDGRRRGRPTTISRSMRERDAARILDAWAARRAA